MFPLTYGWYCKIASLLVPSQQVYVQLDVKTCTAEEIFQECVEYLTHGQLFDWAGRAERVAPPCKKIKYIAHTTHILLKMSFAFSSLCHPYF